MAGIVLTGAGHAFVAGADIREFGKPRPKEAPGLRDVAMQIENCDKPVVAAINGACAGAGLSWACACDIRYAAESAKFNTAFLSAGVSGDFGGTWTLPRIVGPAKARELVRLFSM